MIYNYTREIKNNLLFFIYLTSIWKIIEYKKKKTIYTNQIYGSENKNKKYNNKNY